MLYGCVKNYFIIMDICHESNFGMDCHFVNKRQYRDEPHLVFGKKMSGGTRTSVQPNVPLGGPVLFFYTHAYHFTIRACNNHDTCW
jgi:hypothetical protein